jgi:ABC-type lipoprotein export system ATPase subunit
MTQHLVAHTVGELLEIDPAAVDFIVAAGKGEVRREQSVAAWISALDDDGLNQIGMGREQLSRHIERIVAAATQAAKRQDRPPALSVRSLVVEPGRDKQGRPEPAGFSVCAGEVMCIVGPTGAGKSQLLADIECLAQGDSPSGRHVVIDGMATETAYGMAHKMVAQISQNMNFVVDLTVGAFLAMHAACRNLSASSFRASDVIGCANSLAGEPMTPATSLTQLSGGQARALMIADTAFLSASPVVLIDEIENAGIDRRRALDLLMAKDKIVVISTHDPLLALMGDRRIVVRGGAIAEIIVTSPGEKENLSRLEGYDRRMLALRDRLRHGGCIDQPLTWLPED